MTPRRLLLRIYLVTLAQFLAVGLAYAVIHHTFFRPRPPPFQTGRPEDFAVRRVADHRDDPASLRASLETTRRDFGLRMTLYRRDGSLLGSTHDPVPPPLTEDRLAELEDRPALPGDRPHTVVVPVREKESLVAYGIVDLVGPPPRVQVLPFIVIGMVVRFELGAGGQAAPALQIERIDVGPLLERAASRFRLVNPKHELTVAVELGLPTIEGDAAMLRRVIDNLLVNAHKYSEPHSPVALRGRRDEDRILIEVADRGIGIDPTDVPQIFTPFFRTDRSRARSTGGVGLGLALAKRIVEGHGGTISLASVPNAGTTVTVSLPVHRLPTSAEM